MLNRSGTYSSSNLPSYDSSPSKDSLSKWVRGKIAGNWFGTFRVPKASLWAPPGISCKPLYHVVEISSAFHPWLVASTFCLGGLVWLHGHYFDGIGDL